VTVLIGVTARPKVAVNCPRDVRVLASHVILCDSRVAFCGL
jgi:hypothetical protein